LSAEHAPQVLVGGLATWMLSEAIRLKHIGREDLGELFTLLLMRRMRTPRH
jgi:hypothetical protein